MTRPCPDPLKLGAYAGVTVAVLGAGGFIGRWVSRRLTAYGARLIGVVRNRGAARAVWERYGVRGDLEELDLLDLSALAHWLERIRPAIVFNLAGYGVRSTERNPDLAERTNHALVEALGEGLSRSADPDWRGQQLVHAGSALEYGEVNGDLDEVQTKCEPQTTYGQTKLRGTLNLARHCSRSTFRGVTARLFTVYGPGEPEGRLLPSLMQCAKSGVPLDLTAGQQCRDFTYVDEVAEGLLRLGLANVRPGGVVNLASGRLSSVRSFVETAARILSIPNDRLRFGQLATRPEEMQHGEVAVARLQSLVGWLPSLTIEGGIGRTVEFLEAPAHDWSAQPVAP